MNWKLDESAKEYRSECGNYKIKNAGNKGGCLYAVFTLGSWSCEGQEYKEFIRLVKVGTFDECKNFGG